MMPFFNRIKNVTYDTGSVLEPYSAYTLFWKKVYKWKMGLAFSTDSQSVSFVMTVVCVAPGAPACSILRRRQRFIYSEATRASTWRLFPLYLAPRICVLSVVSKKMASKNGCNSKKDVDLKTGSHKPSKNYSLNLLPFLYIIFNIPFIPYFRG